MKISNTSTRLKKIMTDNNMRQVDILKKVEPYCQVYNIKMNKSDISQYVSGKVEPSQDKLVILSMELTHFPQYTESQILNAAHERTDINIPTDIDTSDNDIMDDENF